MTILPIADRELRVASRSPRTYYSRLWAALTLMVGLSLVFWLQERLGISGSRGHTAFSFLAYLAFGFCLFDGAARTSDCISWEKRADTLGLLFLTDLKGYDIVLGKLAATSLRGVYGLLATFPVLALPLLLGGVKWLEFCQVVLSLVNTLFLSLAVGLRISIQSRNQRRAVHGAAFLMLALAVIPAAAGMLVEVALGAREAGGWLRTFSPLSSFAAAFDPTAGAGGGVVVFGNLLSAPSFWMSFLVIHLAAWLLLATASWILPRSWQQQEGSTALPIRDNRDKDRDPERQLAWRMQALDKNPLFWLVARQERAGRSVWVLVGIVAAWLVWGCAQQEFPSEIASTSFLFLALSSKLIIAFAASYRLIEDRKSGALELLVTTPVTEKQLLHGQWLGSLKLFGAPMIGVLALYLWMWGALSKGLMDANEEITVYMIQASMALSFLDWPALIVVGTRMALQHRHAAHAAAATVGAVALVPALPAFVVAAVKGLAGFEFYLESEAGLFPLIWFWSAVVNNVALTLWALQGVRKEFRESGPVRSVHAGDGARGLPASLLHRTDLRARAARITEP